VAVVGTGRRSITTRGAYQKMLRAGTGPGTGAGTWNRFVRVYTPNLSTVRYSSVLTGAWDTATGAGGDNTVLEAVLPETDRVLAVGWQGESSPGVAAGNPVPTAAVPAWGTAGPLGQSALLARLRTATTAPLPVTLTSFEARRGSPSQVTIQWATAAGVSNEGFTIEKSPDGQQFTGIATVPGHGSSTAPHAYRAEDPAATTAAYYRLAQHDYDGAVSYSPVVFVAAAASARVGAGQLVLLPNPAHGQLRAVVLGATLIGPVHVLDAVGRVRLSRTAADSEATLPVAALPAGMYLVRVQTGAGWLVQRLVVE